MLRRLRFRSLTGLRGGKPAAGLHPVRGALEIGGCFLVRPRGGLRPVPGASAIGDLGQRSGP
jgi:hypothetical protein